MFDIDKKKLGTLIAQLRKEKSLTQKELAEKLFISDKAVSKWETGNSIPDTTLLIPLAEILEISVTELLLCERQKNSIMNSKQVEDVVKTAICYPKIDDSKRRLDLPNKKTKIYIYIFAVIIGCIGAYFNSLQQSHFIFTLTITPIILGIVYGGYFLFFAKAKLPEYYDQYPIHGVYTGLVRMNIPGIQFNNKNWAYVVDNIYKWSCAMLLFWPTFCFLLDKIVPSIVEPLKIFIALGIILCSLFGSIVFAAKKYNK